MKGKTDTLFKFSIAIGGKDNLRLKDILKGGVEAAHPSKGFRGNTSLSC